ncbi:caspase family protein [Actinoplanes friuliensis]|uniref:Mov34/MPN/PAD-1 family protein n=1 Tax=Actinoplanes friuliensis DSM 7358 TaxID=1246995 RepID=U5W4R0_9ACTN|nr:caspase family protein [Actinoplanes friuliensis]AGZ43997.1 Mov34/MPN/PAD-1 family protein [Actinoplanes friuliensis DSM 7358]
MTGIDRRRSRLVLAGIPRYDDEALADVPQAAQNVADLRGVLTDPEIGGFAEEHCLVVPADVNRSGLARAVKRASEEAEDLLIFYFSGHGLLDDHNLHLGLQDSTFEDPGIESIPFDLIRRICLRSSARNKVVILDCCFGGRALGSPLAVSDEVVLADVEISGTYTLTAAPGNKAAVVLPGEVNTAFTGRLLRLLHEGVPGPMKTLTMGMIFRHLDRKSRAEGLPLPQQRNIGMADQIGLVANVAYAPVSHPLATAETGEVPVPVELPHVDPSPARAETLAERVRHGQAASVAADLRAIAEYRPDDQKLWHGRLEQAERAVDLLGAIVATATDGPQLAAEVITEVIAGDRPPSLLLAGLVRGANDSPVARALALVPPETARDLLVYLTLEKYGESSLQEYLGRLIASDKLAEVLTAAVKTYQYSVPVAGVLGAVRLPDLLRQLLDLGHLEAGIVLTWALAPNDLSDDELKNSRTAKTLALACQTLSGTRLARMSRVVALQLRTQPKSAAMLLYHLDRHAPEAGTLLLVRAVDGDNRLGEHLGRLARGTLPLPMAIIARITEHEPATADLLASALVFTDPCSAKKFLDVSLTSQFFFTPPGAPAFGRLIAEKFEVAAHASGWDEVRAAIETGNLELARSLAQAT